MPCRIHAVRVHPCRTSCSIDHVFTAKQDESVSLAVGAGQIQAEKSVNPFFIGQHIDDLHPVEYPYPFLTDRLLKTLRHIPGSIWPRAGGPAPGIMVRLISHILPKTVMGKWHPQLHQPEKTPGRQRRLTQRQIAVHAPARKQGLCHLLHAVRFPACHRKLIIGLLIRTGIAGSSPFYVIRDHGNILLPQGPKPIRRVKSCCPCAYDHRIHLIKPYLTAKPLPAHIRHLPL